jgi:hypothetical protein
MAKKEGLLRSSIAISFMPLDFDELPSGLSLRVEDSRVAA